MEDLIAGVVVKELVSHPDQRGFFREIFRFNEPIFEGGHFAQWSHSKMTKNVVKAWHFHHIQTDWWYVPLGCIEAVLFDNREESPTYKKKMVIIMGDSKSGIEGAKEVVVRIPPGVLHGCKVLTDEAHLLYITSETYNPNDEGRYPYNSEIVPHSWGDNVITSPNDRKTFMPTSERKKF
ncbi:MAG: hypothetical protein D6780_08375 [Candidatus Dadabacteria bacterium]|nr:MAG: hypothetical protein D6780_08375 [Candidatus Dadabacteria bacterium]